MQYNLESVRAHLLREEFQRFWEYASPAWAGKFLESWCTRALRSRLAPMKKVAMSLRRHRPLILNWFVASGAISAGVVEGFNGFPRKNHRLWLDDSRHDDGQGSRECHFAGSRAVCTIP